ncbi:DUF3168 domain-containing protein [Maricaulis sp.]|uniref:DUF3168 domain-containing protein n=1 Tax=Maricaulis sp. TaxID=1486257 RepID=UPI000C670DCE|nr:DUF3168 domain-containing protein [Maricaulis sp.]MAC89657.1 hypothetical protein [Maricaulis sp.]
MADPAELDIQKAVNTRMRAAAAVTSLIGTRFYDAVPARPTFPYARMTPPQVVDDTNSAARMEVVFFEISVFSRQRGRVELARIVDAIRAQMRTQLTLTEHAVTYQNHIDTQYRDDPDGLTQMATMRFEIMTLPSS